ncbi:polyprenyl synthetase [Chloroflexia bacterium SDU3-3]|nr:polyprenyl synthetase [Chloroflexia bacterium SDU3-3]
MTEHHIPELIRDDLAQVDALIRQHIESQPVVARALEAHIGPRRGQPILAALTLLAARLGQPQGDHALHAAATIELLRLVQQVHMAMLDGAARRRGTLHEQPRWDGGLPLMMGDFLLALAATEMAQSPDPQIIEFFSQSVMATSEAELAPVMAAAPADVAVAQYMDLIERRTASLFEAAAKSGAVCGGLGPQEVGLAGRFGRELGLAYQVAQDVADVAGGAGAALRAGVITLPLIYAVDAGADAALLDLLDTQQPSAEQIAWGLAEQARTGGTARAAQDAAQALGRATALLGQLPGGSARQALLAMAEPLGRAGS